MRLARWIADRINAAFEGEDAPLLMKAGHYSRWVITGWAAYSISWDAAGEPWGAWYWHAISGFAGLTFGLSMIGMILHSRRICEPCIAEAPLNPQAQAARWKPVLRASHSTRLTIGFCTAIIIWDLLPKAVVPRGQERYSADIAITVCIVAMSWAQWQHSRLQPWCPFCNWGRGGDKEPSPDVPAPVVSA